MKKQDFKKRKIAYFTMEVGLDPKIATYSGGLGVLAGDTLKSCADLDVPLIAVTLLNEKGYFAQKLDEGGSQAEIPVEWPKEEFLTLLPVQVSVNIEGREVRIRVWEYIVKGITGATIPVYFLDTNLQENAEYDRSLTSFLYGGDQWYRLCQEIILGIGGVRAIEAIGYQNIEKYHMNEGHASLLALELLERTKKDDEEDIYKQYDLESVRNKCIFTTHTPVAAGHDRFPLDLVKRALRSDLPFKMPGLFIRDNEMNMTLIALNLSKYVNGVAKKHGEVTREMFPGYSIDSITNGIHLLTWAAPAFKKLYDKYIPGWQSDYFSLRYAMGIPKEEIFQAHLEAKKELIDYVNARTGIGMNYDIFTIGFARRATAYKRADLLLSDMNRLIEINNKAGRMQIIYAGKAHPKDGGGKELIKKIFSRIKELNPKVRIAYLENYDMTQGKLITAGVDLWLNNPLPPQEASGTSGMKACLNGVPNLSILDGWWIEGCIENVTGWAIGSAQKQNTDSAQDVRDLYQKLENIIIPMFYKEKDKWLEVMRHAIALNASFFNTQRMVQEYVLNAYL
ncbi:MAG: alpha-glucan family phosphorylase [Candidatus Omnitrophica bacterium]|nr:alpha-glucan family phosphorylase [Candidatus Omnitrophota bacterium]MCG2714176.1 alpha-glucan family phosphorylase [Candidatus Omnitrophota bacterium]